MKKLGLSLAVFAVGTVLAGLAVISGCEDEPETDISGMGSYRSDSRHENGLGGLTISPDFATVTANGQQVLFQADRGTPPYTWDTATADGHMVPQGENQALYVVDNVHANQVIVTDAKGSVAVADIIRYTSALKITPSTQALNDGDAAMFTASGGTPPYDWSQVLSLATLTEQGANDYQCVYDDAAGGGLTNTLIVIDSDGSTAQASIIGN